MPSVIGEILPDGGLGEFAVLRDAYLRGGFRVVFDLAERDAITADRRVEGMEVKVLVEEATYTLVGGITNADWEEVMGDFDQSLNTTDSPEFAGWKLDPLATAPSRFFEMTTGVAGQAKMRLGMQPDNRDMGYIPGSKWNRIIANWTLNRPNTADPWGYGYFALPSDDGTLSSGPVIGMQLHWPSLATDATCVIDEATLADPSVFRIVPPAPQVAHRFVTGQLVCVAKGTSEVDRLLPTTGITPALLGVYLLTKTDGTHFTLSRDGVNVAVTASAAPVAVISPVQSEVVLGMGSTQFITCTMWEGNENVRGTTMVGPVAVASYKGDLNAGAIDFDVIGDSTASVNLRVWNNNTTPNIDALASCLTLKGNCLGVGGVAKSALWDICIGRSNAVAAWLKQIWFTGGDIQQTPMRLDGDQNTMFMHPGAVIEWDQSFTDFYPGVPITGGVKLGNGASIQAGTGSGAKIGTATGQKLGFWNATPVVQQVLATGSTADQIITMLQTLGLCRQS